MERRRTRLATAGQPSPPASRTATAAKSRYAKLAALPRAAVLAAAAKGCDLLVSRRAAVMGRAQLRALTFGGALWDAETAKMQTAGTLWGSLWVTSRYPLHFAGA